MANTTTESDRRVPRLQSAGLIIAGGLLAVAGFACGGSKTTTTSPSSTATTSSSTTSSTAAFSLDTASVPFPIDAPAGSTKTVTVTNNGLDTVTIASIAVTGNFLETDDCGTPLEAQATCAITLIFNPIAGATSGTLTVTDTSGSVVTVPVTGPNVNGPNGILAPSSLTFGSQRVGATSVGQAVTLTNPANGVSLSLSIFSVTTTGDFAVAQNACGASLAPGKSCAVTLTFTPSGSGSRSGHFAVVDNAPSGMQSIPLSGTGQ
jgi:hypothetical protein